MLRLTPSPAACDQVLDVDGWSDRLGLDTRHVGTAMTPDEVFGIITKVDLAALRGYRAATGAATVAAVNALCAPDGAYRNERAQWMDQFWAGHDVARFLSFLNVHTTQHAIGEALAVCGLLARPSDRDRPNIGLVKSGVSSDSTAGSCLYGRVVMGTNDPVGWCEIRVEIDEAGAHAYVLGWGAGTRHVPHDLAEPSAEPESSSPKALDPLPWAE